MTANNAFERAVTQLETCRRLCGWLASDATWPAAQLGR